jgi:choline kinase
MQLVILASGRGSRLGINTKLKPKCLVDVLKIPIIDYMTPLFDNFTEIIVIAGYKINKIENHFIGNKKVKIIRNKDYMSTNMVYSFSLVKKYIKDDFIVSYGDIIFDKNIILQIIKKNLTIMPINKNWMEYWSLRMNYKDLVKDAENLIIKENNLVEIGTKIDKILPKFQFMGIMKFKKKDFFSFINYFKKINNAKIDFTSFTNLCLKKKIIKINVSKTNLYWFEIDNEKDLKVASKILKKRAGLR